MKQSKRLFVILTALVLTLALATTTTFAWFSMNERVNVTGIQVDVTTSGGMQVRANGLGAWRTNLDSTDLGMPGTDTRTTYLVPRTISNLDAYYTTLTDINDIEMLFGNINNNSDTSNYLAYSETKVLTIEEYVNYMNTNSTDTAFLEAGFLVQDFNLRTDVDSTIYLSKLTVTPSIPGGDRRASVPGSYNMNDYISDSATLANYTHDDCLQYVVTGDTTLTSVPVVEWANYVAAGGTGTRKVDATDPTGYETIEVDDCPYMHENLADVIDADGANAIRVAILIKTYKTDADTSTTGDQPGWVWELLTVINPNSDKGFDLNNLAQDIQNDSYHADGSYYYVITGDTSSPVKNKVLVSEWDSYLATGGTGTRTQINDFAGRTPGSTGYVDTYQTVSEGFSDTQATEYSGVVELTAAKGIQSGYSALGTTNQNFVENKGLKIAELDVSIVEASGVETSTADEFGYVDVRVVIWIEGKDGDCLDGAIGDKVNVEISFFSEE